MGFDLPLRYRRYRHAPAGGGIRIAVAVRAMNAVIRRAAVRGAVPCRISTAVSFLRLVEYCFSSHRTVMSFRHPAGRFFVSCRIRLHCVWHVMPVWKYGLPCSPFRFCLASSRRIVLSPRHVSSFRLVLSLRLISTRSAIRFVRYGRREEGVIRLFVCAMVLNNSV